MTPPTAGALVLALIAAAAHAAPPLPAPVQEMTDAAAARCREAGGALSLAPDYARPADLNGDGLDDYLVDSIGLVCEGTGAGFCGPEGCPVAVWLSSPGGHRRVWSGTARASYLNTSTEPPGIVIERGGEFCDPPRAAAETCETRLDLADAASAEGDGAQDRSAGTATDRPEGWTLRATPGSEPVAVAPLPAPLRDMALFCLSGQPFIALVPETEAALTETVQVSFAFSGETLSGTARREASAGNSYVIDEAGARIARALAGPDASVDLELDGTPLGTVSLAGSSRTIRTALDDCLKL